MSTALSRWTHLWKYFWWLSNVVANITRTKRVVHLSKSSKISTKKKHYNRTITNHISVNYLFSMAWNPLIRHGFNEHYYLFQLNLKANSLEDIATISTSKFCNAPLAFFGYCIIPNSTPVTFRHLPKSNCCKKKSQLCFLVFISLFRSIFKRICDICFIFCYVFSRFVSFFDEDVWIILDQNCRRFLQVLLETS